MNVHAARFRGTTLKLILSTCLICAWTGCSRPFQAKAPVSVTYEGEDMQGPAMLKIRNISGAEIVIHSVEINDAWIADGWLLRDENTDPLSLLAAMFKGGDPFPAKLGQNHIAIVIVDTGATVKDAYKALISTSGGSWEYTF